jgi:hypothetical protein
VEGITQLTVGTTPTTGELTQFLRDGVKEVVNRIIKIRPDELNKFTTSTHDAADNGITASGRILSVVREHDSVNILRNCTLIAPGDRYAASDSTSLRYRSAYNPGFYELAGKIHTIPASAAGNNDSIVTQVAYYLPSFDDVSLDNFPDEYEYLVTLYASLRSIHATMGVKTTTTLDAFNPLPILSLKAAPTIGNLSISAVPPVGLIDPNITDPGVSTISKADIIGNIPTYTKPSTDISISSPIVPTLETLATFNLTAVAPDSILDPVITSDGVATVGKPDVTTTPPQYSGGSVVGFSSSFATLATKTVTDLSIKAVPPDTPGELIDTFSSVPSYDVPQVGGVTEALTAGITAGNSQTDVSDWFEVAGDYIQTEEDSELASSQLDKIAGYITAYSAQVANNLNKFNADNVIYQADIQKKVKEADLDMSKFSAELTEYQQEVNREVTEWNANKDKDIELWNNQQNQIIAQQSAQMQDALNLFNKENAIFQADIQATLAKSQIDTQEYQKEGDLLFQAKVQDYTLTLQKYQAETQVYQAEVASEVQVYTQQLQDVTTANASNLQRYQNELAFYQAEVGKEAQTIQANLQNELNEFNKENIIYQANIQAELAKFQADAQEAQKEGDLTLQSSIQDYTLTLQKFQAAVASYQAEVATEVQEYTQNLAGDIQVWQAERTTDLTAYQSEISEYQIDTQAKIGKHTQELQASNAEYQWLQDQYTRIKTEYDTAFVALAPPQSVPKNERN